MPKTFQIDDDFVLDKVRGSMVLAVFARDFTQEEYENYIESGIQNNVFDNAEEGDKLFDENPPIIYESQVFNDVEELNEYIEIMENEAPDSQVLLSYYNINGLGHIS